MANYLNKELYNSLSEHIDNYEFEDALEIISNKTTINS